MNTWCNYLSVAVLAVPMSVFALDEAAELAAAREASKGLLGQLKAELLAAMEQGGPVAAIEVCQTRAPTIAAEISTKSGREVHRTSLKPRARKPDAWESEVLKVFDAKVAQGEDAAQLETHAVVTENGQSVFRFAKAIPVQAMCLKCHGTEIALPVAAKLQSLYPEDQAIGYSVGQVRGIVSVRHPLP